MVALVERDAGLDAAHEGGGAMSDRERSAYNAGMWSGVSYTAIGAGVTEHTAHGWTWALAGYAAAWLAMQAISTWLMPRRATGEPERTRAELERLRAESAKRSADHRALLTRIRGHVANCPCMACRGDA